MRRKVQTYPFARLRVTNLARSPLSKLPCHLQLAYSILAEELKFPTLKARCILDESVKYALSCAQEINNRDLRLSRENSTGKVRASFSRIAKCITRMPAGLRNQLDASVYGIIADVIDSEVIQEIIDASYGIFVCSKSEPAKTALRALIVSDSIPLPEKLGLNGAIVQSPKNPRGNKKTVGLKTNYEALDPTIHRRCELAVGALPRGSASGTATNVFKALAKAIDTPPDGAETISREASDLIVNYVAKVGALWNNNSLPVSRANHPDDPKYRSRFHRFVELVLTAVTEAGSNRHTTDINEITRQIRINHGLLPPEERNKIGIGLRRVDREWLVSEDHIRKATLKTGHDTP